MSAAAAHLADYVFCHAPCILTLGSCSVRLCVCALAVRLGRGFIWRDDDHQRNHHFEFGPRAPPGSDVVASYCFPPSPRPGGGTLPALCYHIEPCRLSCEDRLAGTTSHLQPRRASILTPG